MRNARHTAVLRVAQNGGTQFFAPAQPLQLAHTHERMLLGCGVALIVEVMQQGRRRIKLDERSARFPLQPETAGFGLAARRHAGFDSQRVFTQALTLSPLGQQLPGLFASIAGTIAQCIISSAVIHCFLPLDVAQSGSCFSRFYRTF